VQEQRLRKKEHARKRWQRRMARRTKGSAGWRKAKRRVAQCQQYAWNEIRLLVFEALRIRAMSARPKAKRDESGRWLKNQARAKAGLNSRILASAWGRTLTLAQYKALRRNKLVVTVPPHHSSQSVANAATPIRTTGPRKLCLSANAAASDLMPITMPAWSFATAVWH